MGGSDKIDVMASLFLEANHKSCHFFPGGNSSLSQMADVIVLAEHTFKIAMGEKNGAGPLSPGKGQLFPEVGENA